MITRPMLAATARNKAELIKYWPGTVLASPKLDGIRCLTHSTLGPVSRNFKPIPNDWVRCRLKNQPYLDGEIITFTDDAMDDFSTTQSKVMSVDGEPDFRFLVFDSFYVPDTPFSHRLEYAAQSTGLGIPEVELLPQVEMYTPEKFLELAEICVSEGYEGAMYRHPLEVYKSGRSTLREGGLVKWKQFADAEGVIIGFEEKLHNSNPQTKDAFGRSERSSHKAGMLPTGTLGALVLQTMWGVLRVGTGYTDVQRRHLWLGQSGLMGSMVTFKYQAEGSKDLPRFPVFKSLRVPE